MFCYIILYGCFCGFGLIKGLDVWEKFRNVQLLMTEFDRLEVTLCGWLNIKIQIVAGFVVVSFYTLTFFIFYVCVCVCVCVCVAELVDMTWACLRPTFITVFVTPEVTLFVWRDVDLIFVSGSQQSLMAASHTEVPGPWVPGFPPGSVSGALRATVVSNGLRTLQVLRRPKASAQGGGLMLDRF